VLQCPLRSTQGASAVFMDNYGAMLYLNDAASTAMTPNNGIGAGGVWYANAPNGIITSAQPAGQGGVQHEGEQYNKDWGYKCAGTANTLQMTKWTATRNNNQNGSQHNSQFAKPKWGFKTGCANFQTARPVGCTSVATCMLVGYNNGFPFYMSYSPCEMAGCSRIFKNGMLQCTSSSRMAVDRSPSATTIYISQDGPGYEKKFYSSKCKGIQRRSLRADGDGDRALSSAVANPASTKPASSQNLEMKCPTFVAHNLASTTLQSMGHMSFTNGVLFVTDKKGVGVYKIGNPALTTGSTAALYMREVGQVNGIFAFYASPAASIAPAAMVALVVTAVAKLLC